MPDIFYTGKNVQPGRLLSFGPVIQLNVVRSVNFWRVFLGTIICWYLLNRGLSGYQDIEMSQIGRLITVHTKKMRLIVFSYTHNELVSLKFFPTCIPLSFYRPSSRIGGALIFNATSVLILVCRPATFRSICSQEYSLYGQIIIS